MIEEDNIKAGDRLCWEGIRGTVYGTAIEVGADIIVRIDGAGYLPLDDIRNSHSITKL